MKSETRKKRIVPVIFAKGFLLTDLFLICVVAFGVFTIVSAYHWSAQRTDIYYVYPVAFMLCAVLALKPRLSIAYYALSALLVLVTIGAIGRNLATGVAADIFNLFLNPLPLVGTFGMCTMVGLLWKKGQSVSRFGDYWQP